MVTPYWNITADGKLWCSEARIIGEITARSGTFDNCTINETCTITKIEAEKGTIGGFNIYSGAIGTTEGAGSGKSGVTINAKELVYSDGTHYVSIDAEKIYTYNSYVQILSGVTDSYGDVVSVPYGRGYFKTLRIDRLNSTKANADKDGCIYVENGFLKVKIS